MIQALFLILKIIGILLLLLAGLLLLALAAVLFVPVRYRGEGSRREVLKAHGTVSWCFSALAVRFSLEDGRTEGEVRLFGRRLGGRDREEETLEADFREASEPSVHTASLDRGRSQDGEDTPDGGNAPDSGNTPDSGSAPDSGSVPAGGRSQDRAKERESRNRSGAPGRREKAKEEGKGPGTERPSGRLEKLARELRGRISRAGAKIRSALEKKDQIMAFLRDEENRRTFRLVKKQLVKVVRHVMPVRLEGEVTFGFDDPYRTGQLLSAAALLYPVYRDRIRITPVFDREVLEGELKLEGRIRLAVLLGAAVRLGMDRNFRKLVRRLMDR